MSDQTCQNKVQYFELSIKPIKLHSLPPSSSDNFLFELKNITAAIVNQQKKSDQIYQNAIEANFSHEQMNPLNNIMQNSATVSGIISKIAKTQANNSKMDDALKFMKAITHSGKALWYFTQN